MNNNTFSHVISLFLSILPTSGRLNCPMTVDIAMQEEEKLSPIIACTWAGLMHGASDGANATSLPLAKASATLTPLAMDAQAS